MKILVFGSLNKDHVYSVEHIVKPGETIASTGYSLFWGGKGLNQSIALSKAGAPVAFACNVSGEDEAAVKELFKSYGLGADYLSAGGSFTGHAIIQVDSGGQNSILLYPGANHEISGEVIDRVLSNFGGGDFLLLQNEINNIDYIIRAANKRGIRIVLNPSPFTKELLSLPLELVDMFILNEIEGEQLSGTDDTKLMPGLILEKYPKAQIILTLGEKGAVYADADRRFTQCAYPAEAVDTTAAGDTFTGFFLAEYMRKGQVQDALNLAAKAAAIAVTVKGAANSIPMLADAL